MQGISEAEKREKRQEEEESRGREGLQHGRSVELVALKKMAPAKNRAYSSCGELFPTY